MDPACIGPGILCGANIVFTMQCRYALEVVVHKDIFFHRHTNSITERSDIYRYPDDPERLEIKDPHDLKDIKNFYAVSMILFTPINRVIDLGDEIVTSGNRTYRDIPGDIQSSGA